MKIFLTISAILAWIFGLALLLVPGAFYAPLGASITPLLGTLAQAHGATLFGVGVILWMVRNAGVNAIRPVLWGNLFIQVLSLSVVFYTMSLGPGLGLFPGAVIHITLGSFTAYFLYKTRLASNLKKEIHSH